MTQSRTERTAYVGVVCSVVAVLALLAAPWHWLALAGALVLACVPAGAAVMCWIDSGEDAAQVGLTLVLSLTGIAIASALMIWTAAWHPQVLLVLAGASTVSCAARLRQRASR